MLSIADQSWRLFLLHGGVSRAVAVGAGPGGVAAVREEVNTWFTAEHGGGVKRKFSFWIVLSSDLR